MALLNEPLAPDFQGRAVILGLPFPLRLKGLKHLVKVTQLLVVGVRFKPSSSDQRAKPFPPHRVMREGSRTDLSLQTSGLRRGLHAMRDSVFPPIWTLPHPVGCTGDLNKLSVHPRHRWQVERLLNQGSGTTLGLRYRDGAQVQLCHNSRGVPAPSRTPL